MTGQNEEKKEKEKEEKRFLRTDRRAHQSKVIQYVLANLKIVLLLGQKIVLYLNSDLNTLSKNGMDSLFKRHLMQND